MQVYGLAAYCPLPLLACISYSRFSRLNLHGESVAVRAMMFFQGATEAARGKQVGKHLICLHLLPPLTASVVDVCITPL